MPTLSFFFTDPPTTEIYTLSLHDALPICFLVCTMKSRARNCWRSRYSWEARACCQESAIPSRRRRSEEHTSELQSRGHLVCRLLLEKKKTTSESDTLIE